jgi:hypothetical protein
VGQVGERVVSAGRARQDERRLRHHGQPGHREAVGKASRRMTLMALMALAARGRLRVVALADAP